MALAVGNCPLLCYTTIMIMKLLACDRQRTVSDLEMQVRVHMRKMCRNDYGVRARGLGDNAQCLDYLACVWFACRSSR